LLCEERNFIAFPFWEKLFLNRFKTILAFFLQTCFSSFSFRNHERASSRRTLVIPKTETETSKLPMGMETTHRVDYGEKKLPRVDTPVQAFLHDKVSSRLFSTKAPTFDFRSTFQVNSNHCKNDHDDVGCFQLVINKMWCASAHDCRRFHNFYLVLPFACNSAFMEWSSGRSCTQTDFFPVIHKFS